MNSFDKGRISRKAANSLMNNNINETIANALANIFIIRRKADAMFADYFKLENKHGLCDKIFIKDDSVLEKFLNSGIKVRKDMAKIMLSRDNFLKDLKGIFIV